MLNVKFLIFLFYLFVSIQNLISENFTFKWEQTSFEIMCYIKNIN